MFIYSLITPFSSDVFVFNSIAQLSTITTSIFIVSELYWTFYKWNLANAAASCVDKSIENLVRISKNGEMMIMKSSWSTLFNEKGYYHYQCDYSSRYNKWKQLEFDCIYK